MATVNGVNSTLAATPTGANIIKPGLLGGRVRAVQEQYEAAALASGSIIEIGQKLPIGATVVGALISSDNLGNSATLQLGDYEDDNRYITATDHGSGAAQTRLNTVDGLFYTIDETYTGTTVGSGSDRQLIITTGVGEATGTINVVVLYTID